MKYKIKELKKKYITNELFETLSHLSDSTKTNIHKGRKIFKEIKKNKNHFIYAAIDKKSDEIIGMITLLVEPKFIHDCGYLGHIEDVVTRVGHEGQGIGKELVKTAVKQAKKSDCYRVILNCSEDNREFYEKCGFRKKEIEMVKDL
ncbi:MAG: GNAT family N-acetyltransferase [bacterium]|nr:GNAT family N-acetyltransferase [bacterium]